MDFSSPEMAGILGALAVFCLLAAYYLKSDYLQENFLKMKEEKISWDTKKKNDKTKQADELLKSLGSKKSYKDLKQQGLLITIALIAVIIVSGCPAVLAVLPLGIYYKYPDIMIKRMQRKRLDQIQGQLMNAIERIQQVLNVGGQMSQGFEEAANECKEPIAGEFRKICIDLSTGASMEDALNGFYKRCPLPDVQTLKVGCSISDTVSKEVAVQALKMAESIIYKRMKQTSEIKALVKNGEIIINIMGAAPIVAVAAMEVIMPSAFNSFLNSPYGAIAVVAAVVLTVGGYLLGRRITDPNRIINY